MIKLTLKRLYLTLGLLVLTSLSVIGQNVSKQYCKNIETSTIQPLKPTSIDIRMVLDDECWFDFTVPDKVDVSLTIHISETEEGSKKYINDYLFTTAFSHGFESEEKLPLEKLDTGNCWDEVYFHKVRGFDSGIIWLRKGKVAITMLSERSGILIQMEKPLRDEIGCK